MTSNVIYDGDLRTRATHTFSGNSIITDAPLDNHGKAEAFSPTDLVATALASCMLTVMGIKAKQMDLDANLIGTEAEVEKIMASEPRRISGINVRLTFPANNFTDKEKTILEHTARTCPVSQTLNGNVDQVVNFIWL
jgi:putative redox protein